MARRKTIADAEAAEAARFLEGATEIGPLDPVDTAIAKHRAAWTKMVALYEATKTSKPKYKAVDAMKAYDKIYMAETDTFVVTPLDTIAQIIAFSAYIGRLWPGHGAWDCPDPVWVWHLSNALENVADALERLASAPVATARAPLPLAA